MNILHINGLAAFLFRQRAYSPISSNNKSQSITGSIPDQLAGLKLACEITSKSAPCLLHINLDRELFEHEDEEIRDGEENRLLSTIKEQLLLNARTLYSMHDIAPIFIVISTSTELRNGPISSNLMSDSVLIKSKEGTESNKNDMESTKVSSLIPNIRWADVGGLTYVREEIMDAIELPLKYPKLFGKSKRSGILLYGPPGTGKTLIAKAVATECGLPFLSVKGPELLGSYIGESEKNIRDTFDSAREAALNGNDDRSGAILFFDEIDSLAPRRGGVGDGGGVMERVVATFLSEMDKELTPSGSNSEQDKASLLFVIGATNRPDLLDPSLLRPGRFDRLVYLGVTKHRKDRVSILASLTRKFNFEDDVSATIMAEKVIDFLPQSLTGADFSAVCNNALMIAVKRLCEKADEDLKRIQADPNCNEKFDIGKILSGWDESRCIPKVRPDDFKMAANGIVPMIKEEDLKKYEALRNKFHS